MSSRSCIREVSSDQFWIWLNIFAETNIRSDKYVHVFRSLHQTWSIRMAKVNSLWSRRHGSWSNYGMTPGKLVHASNTEQMNSHLCRSGLCFNIWQDFLSQDLVKSRSCEIGCLNHCIALKFDSHVGSTVAEAPDNQNNRTSLNSNLATSRLCKILQ